MILRRGAATHKILLKRPHKKGAAAFTMGQRTDDVVTTSKKDLISWLKQIITTKTANSYKFFNKSEISLLSYYLYSDKDKLFRHLNFRINQITYTWLRNGSATKTTASNMILNKKMWGLYIDIDKGVNLLFYVRYGIDYDKPFNPKYKSSWVIKFDFTLNG